MLADSEHGGNSVPADLPQIYWHPILFIHRRYDRGGYVEVYEDKDLDIIRTHSRTHREATLVITWRIGDDLTNTEYRDYPRFAKAFYDRFPWRVEEMQAIAYERAAQKRGEKFYEPLV